MLSDELLRFDKFKTHWIAVFVHPGGREFRLNAEALANRIANMINGAPGYDPDPARAVLVELRERNARLATEATPAERTG